MTYNPDTKKMQGSWKVPEVESMNRQFNETSRYYNTQPYQRKHGLRYVPPPVAENVQQLVQEQKLYDLKHKFEKLNQDQKAAMVDVMSKTVMTDKKPEDIISLLSNKDSNYKSGRKLPGKLVQVHRRGRSQQVDYQKSRNGQSSNADGNVSKSTANRVLNIAGGKMGSAF